MPVQVTVLQVAGVGVSVEVNEADVARFAALYSQRIS